MERPDREQLKAYTQLRDEIEKHNTSGKNENNYNFVGENFARLNVYLKQLESFDREQKQSYLISTLFSDIGGTLGLWVGLSLLTLIELLQLAIRIMLVMFGKVIH